MGFCSAWCNINRCFHRHLQLGTDVVERTLCFSCCLVSSRDHAPSHVDGRFNVETQVCETETVMIVCLFSATWCKISGGKCALNKIYTEIRSTIAGDQRLWAGRIEDFVQAETWNFAQTTTGSLHNESTIAAYPKKSGICAGNRSKRR